MRTPRLLTAITITLALFIAACGSDDADTADGEASDTTAAVETTETTEAADAADDTDTTEAEDDDAEGDGSGSITIYSGRGEDLVGPLVEQFSEATGIEAEVRYGDSAEMLLLIQEEGDNSPADVFYSQGAGFLGTLSAEGGLNELDPSVLEQVPPSLQSPAGDWVGTSGRARVVAYNTEVLSEEDLPSSIVDFAEPEWAGRVGYAPTNASFQDFVTALRSLVGEDAARAWLEGLIANGAVAYEGNTAIVEAVAAGEVDVGLTNHYYLFRYLAEDPEFPVANKYYSDGDPGALINIAGAGVVSATDNPDAAAEFVAYLLSLEAQQYFVDETFELPLVEGVDPPAETPALDSLTLPEFDLNLLLDLQGTIDLLTEVGAL